MQLKANNPDCLFKHGNRLTIAGLHDLCKVSVASKHSLLPFVPFSTPALDMVYTMDPWN